MNLFKILPTPFRRRLIRSLFAADGREHVILPGIRWKIEIWEGPFDEDIPSAVLRADPKRYGRAIELGYNGVVNAGEDALIDGITGRATTAFNAANAYLGVGDSTTAYAETQTDLQASTNKLRKGMNATYPKNNGTAQTEDWQADFGSSEANFAWQEWALFNASSAGTMFSRKVESLGTKASGSTWTLTATMDFTGV